MYFFILSLLINNYILIATSSFLDSVRKLPLFANGMIPQVLLWHKLNYRPWSENKWNYKILFYTFPFEKLELIMQLHTEPCWMDLFIKYLD